MRFPRWTLRFHGDHVAARGNPSPLFENPRGICSVVVRVRPARPQQGTRSPGICPGASCPGALPIRKPPLEMIFPSSVVSKEGLARARTVTLGLPPLRSKSNHGGAFNTCCEAFRAHARPSSRLASTPCQ